MDEDGGGLRVNFCFVKSTPFVSCFLLVELLLLSFTLIKLCYCSFKAFFSIRKNIIGVSLCFSWKNNKTTVFKLEM